jgi:hypothetical protein
MKECKTKVRWQMTKIIVIRMKIIKFNKILRLEFNRFNLKTSECCCSFDKSKQKKICLIYF